MISMRDVFGRALSAAEVVGCAVRVTGAVQSRVKPNPKDLRRLGMDPRAFTTIGHG